MVNRILNLLLLLAILAATIGCAPDSGKLTVDQLVGNYSTVSGYDATEIILGKTATNKLEFNSFLRGRPYESGTWELKGSDLIVQVSNNTYTYKEVSLKGKTLSFMENGKPAKFTRTVDSTAGTAPARVETLPDLLARISRSIDPSFPTPTPVVFEWRLKGDKTVQVNGYRTVAIVTVNGNFTSVNKSGELLAAEGFGSDPYNTSEILSGFIKDRDVFLVAIRSAPEDDQSCTVEISCGTLP